MNRWAGIAVAVLAVFSGLALLTRWLSSRRPSHLGVSEGQLAPCPDRPNCVSSQVADSHTIEPLRFEGDPRIAWQRLIEIVHDMPRCRVISQNDDYLHAEVRSLVFGFVDDLEFVLANDCIHVRSASRLGYSDLGVNRRRVEQIRRALDEAWLKQCR